MQNIIIYDWISFTTKISSPESIISLLGLENETWEEIRGANGYKDRKYCNKINIHYNGFNEGIWVEMSGQGCRYFEEHSQTTYENLFDFILDNPEEANLTRLDIAYDDHNNYLNIDKVISDTQNQNYISKSTEWEVRLSSKGKSCIIGSPQSDTLIRIYDKAAERGITDGTTWTRVELQLRNDRALSFIKLPGTIGYNYSGVLHNYLRYLIPTNDTNKSRWKTRQYWNKIINQAEKISIYDKPGTEYNLMDCENYVYKQAGNAITALIKIKGIEKFEAELNETPRLSNKKYEQLINQYT